ncbi:MULTISPECIES: YceI family protein [unclassified Streptomyces]|uniref:YceI family protein n=1 Tax=unclassified Streptomyces TaxID=2593676 RepID=UPI002E19618A|nr:MULTISPECIES: YceI family protein [unclassified Streptomyces]
MSTITNLTELTGHYAIDPRHTRIGFVARHTMATRVRGRFEDFEGSAYLDGGNPAKSGARLTIQATSIQSGNRRRDDMLRDKFLDADAHPTLAFTSTGLKQVDRSNYQLSGDLTLRGLTRPVTVNIELTDGGSGPEGDFFAGFKACLTINRNDWGVNWNTFTAFTLSPKVTLECDVIAVRQH